MGSAGLVTADEFFWIVRYGAVVLHRWLGGHVVLQPGDYADGTKLRVKRGEIVEVISVPETSQDGEQSPADGTAGQDGSRDTSHGGDQDRAAVPSNTERTP